MWEVFSYNNNDNNNNNIIIVLFSRWEIVQLYILILYSTCFCFKYLIKWSTEEKGYFGK